MAENLLQAPKLSGVMYQTTEYSNLGIGLTDQVMVLGHADGLDLNTPYPVTDMHDMVQRMNADATSPLLRGMLEAYYAGARDLWVVAVAPMSEYVQDPDERDDEFYETYLERLTTAYDLLVDFETPQLIVPLDAPIFGAGDVDFLTPLANFCKDSFDITGSVKIGFIGTVLPVISAELIDEMVADERLDSLGSAGKFVMTIIGSGMMNMVEVPFSYSTSPIAAMAGMCSDQLWDRGLTYTRIPNVIAMDFPEFKKDQLKKLCDAKLNPLAKTTRSRRGLSNEIILLSDNTLGMNGTDFWSINQVRLVMHCIEGIKLLGNRHLGTTGYMSFQDDVTQFMVSMVGNDMIREYTLEMELVKATVKGRGTIAANVDVTLKPYGGLRDISFTAKVGPGV